MLAIRRAILAYNPSCSLCVETARNVEAAAKGKLEVSPINSDEVLSYFKQAGGKHGHRPALIQVQDGKARVFEGLLLAAQMTKRLGPRRTYEVLQALGDEPSVPTPRRTVTRKRFLSAGLGASAAISMLMAGAGAATAEGPPRHKDATWIEEETILESTEMSEEDARRALRDFLASSAGSDLSAKFPISGAADLEVRGVRHATETGSFTAVSAVLKSEVLLVFSRNGDGKTMVSSTLLGASEYDSNGEAQRVQLLATTHRDNVDLVEVTTAAGGGYTTLSTCNQTTCRAQGRCYSCTCTSWNAACLATCCATCALSCGAVWSCVACVGIWCPVCVNWAGNCCTSRSCRYRASHTC